MNLEICLLSTVRQDENLSNSVYQEVHTYVQGMMVVNIVFEIVQSGPEPYWRRVRRLLCHNGSERQIFQMDLFRETQQRG